MKRGAWDEKDECERREREEWKFASCMVDGTEAEKCKNSIEVMREDEKEDSEGEVDLEDLTCNDIGTERSTQLEGVNLGRTAEM